jgi:hypothetical protein
MNSFKADVDNQEVQFRVTDKELYDEKELLDAFKKKRFSDTKVVNKSW